MRGYDCVVYCRKSSGAQTPEFYEGRRLKYVKGRSTPELDTVLSSLQTGWELLCSRREYSHIFWFNNANLLGILLTLLARIPMSVNTDGMEWRRAKWRSPFKAYSFLSAFLIARLCKSLISDSRAIQLYYKKTFSKNTQFIPYGVRRPLGVSAERESAILERFGVLPGRYLLQVTRFEPDNLPLEIARAFEASRLAKDDFKLLLVGYQRETPYTQQIKAMSHREGILVADASFDSEVLTVLRSNCFCYVHGNSVGGTNPALLEAMVSCQRVLAIDVAFNREVLGSAGYFYTPDDMVESLRNVLQLPDCSVAMQDQARSHYDWEAVVESYIRLSQGKLAAYSPASSME